MNVGLTTALDQLDRAYASCGRARDRQEAVQSLRQAFDQAQRVLNNLVPSGRDRERRHLAGPLTGAVELAEGTLRAHKPHDHLSLWRRHRHPSASAVERL